MTKLISATSLASWSTNLWNRNVPYKLLLSFGTVNCTFTTISALYSIIWVAMKDIRKFQDDYGQYFTVARIMKYIYHRGG